jgi:hypothetical protein
MNKSYWTGFLSGITILSLGSVALLLSSGFQGASMKIGNVDGHREGALRVLKERRF